MKPGKSEEAPLRGLVTDQTLAGVTCDIGVNDSCLATSPLGLWLKSHHHSLIHCSLFYIAHILNNL